MSTEQEAIELSIARINEALGVARSEVQTLQGQGVDVKVDVLQSSGQPREEIPLDPLDIPYRIRGYAINRRVKV